MFKTSDVYHANFTATEPIVVNQGGTSSGKTYSIMQTLFSKAISQQNKVITVVGQDVPSLKSGALRDALTIRDESEELKSLILSYNKTDRIFTFTSGTIMEFKSYLNPQSAKNGKRDYLFMNEANGHSYQIYEQLALRTKEQIYIDYNPDAEFWVHENLIGKPGVKLIISDHRHNPFVAQSIRDKIEALRDKDLDLFKVYGRGLTGKIEGLIFRNYNIVDEIPTGSKLIAYGMDFGFTNDPTTCLGVWMNGGELYIKELIYETGLTNPKIAEKLRQSNITPQEEIIADSAEPKSIQEIYNERFNIKGALKGADSIKNSIDVLRRYTLNITSDSLNLRKEIKSYKWKQDKDGKTINEPVDFNNHAIDALRYVALNKLAKSNSGHYAIT